MKLRFVVVCVFLVSAMLFGQTFRGTILGTVTDPSEKLVAGATVNVRNAGTGLERTTTTSADGSYSVSELPIGTYTVTVTQTGFQTFVASGVSVNVATERRVDAVLKIGQVATKVEVSAGELPLVETTTNDLGGVITQQTVEDMPVNGRDYTKLIFMNPGVAGSPDQISDSPGSFGEFSMNGARGRSNNYLLDGTDMNDGYRNDPAINQAGVFGTPSTILPIDAVAEVNVLSNFEPEYGRNAGAVVNIVTRSGTNSFHGTAGEYFRNSALDARNFFNPVKNADGTSNPKAPFHNNQYGASLGGPIVKDKTFFYLDYEGQQEPVGVVTVASVPTGTASDGSLQPSDASNQVIAALLAQKPWPAPNLARGALFEAGTASVVSPSFNKLTSFIAKIDKNFNTNNILTGRYFFGDSVQSFPLALTASGGQLPGFNTFTPTRVQLVSISYTHIFGANKLNELRYGWNRFAEGFFPDDQKFHPSSIGLCAATDTALCNGSGPSDSGLPIILVGGVAQLGATSSVPRHRFDTNNQILDNFSWKINKNDVKVGFDFHRTSVQQFFDKFFRGRLKFSGVQDFLDGVVDSGFQYFGDSTRHTFENAFGFYIQNRYRVTSRLTLNYGFRYDYFGVVGEKNNLLSNVTSVSPSPGDGTFTLTQVGQPGLRSLYNPDKKDFAPRVSAAWDVTGKGKTVIRAGFGMFFDAFSQDMVLGHLPYAPFFDPGPAYNNIGPAPILSTGLSDDTVNFGISSGVPVYAATQTCNFECDVFAFDRNIKMPYMENYNLNIQQQISSKAVLQVSYVGSQGHRLWRFRDIGQPSTAEINAADIACDCINDFGGAARPLNANPYGAFYVLQENSTGKSNYNAVQTSFRINGWHGVTSVLNYVYSKSLDNSSDGEDFEPNAAQPNDSTQPQLEYGPSNFNIPHRFTWNFSYDFPIMGGSWKKLKNGWGINSILTLQSGQPFHLNYNFQDDYSGSGNAFDRPDVVGPIVYHKRDPFNYLALSSFAIPCSVDVSVPSSFASDCTIGTRHFGNLGRNSLSGPTFKEWNFSLYKKTQITERVSMKLGVDFFNILNHPNFANPLLPAFIADAGGTVPHPTCDTGDGTGPGNCNFFLNGSGREVSNGPLKITATGDVGIGNPFIGGGGPRGIQLAVKFTF
jgi:Carboxypeptidase regulatory-like domain/TonB dependent receptor/TonB-dependent Receptor Plug Domain